MVSRLGGRRPSSTRRPSFSSRSRRVARLLASRGPRTSSSICGRTVRSFAELAAARRGKAHYVAPAVFGIAVAFDKALLLEAVEHPDQLTSVEAEVIGDGPLCVLGPLVEQAEDAQVVHAGSGPLEGSQGVGLGAGAEVAEEESGSCRAAPSACPPSVIRSSHKSSATEE